MSIVSGTVGAILGKEGSEDQADAAREGTETQWKMYEQSREDLAPWREEGANALKKYAEILYAGPGKFEKSPGYEFRLSEGNKAIERSAAARGNVLGGKTLKALSKYNQDYATNDYDNFLRRYYEKLNAYGPLSNLGQTTSAQTAALGANAANAVNENLITAGNAAMNGANAITGSINSGINNTLAAYQLWKSGSGNNAALQYFGSPSGSTAVTNSATQLTDYVMGGYNASEAMYGGQ